MDMSTPPPIPTRTRQHGGNRSAPDSPARLMKPSDANRVHVQPASPEVISNLITSLSIISTPANNLFEGDIGRALSSNSPEPSNSFHAVDNYMHQRPHNNGGSFGIDYGAFNQPSLEEAPEEGPLEELAASPPVIRTSKPPSGFSPLTAPKSPSKESNLRSFLRNSRPNSKDSNGSKEFGETSSIGGVSIEPGVPAQELRRMNSSDSWGKKQGRNHKGLNYMSSKEKLREAAKRVGTTAASGPPKGLGLDRATLGSYDSASFMAERPISEEIAANQGELYSSKDLYADAAPSPRIGGSFPALPNPSQGGIGSGRIIPTRDSSLRSKKRTQKTQSSRKREVDAGEETIKETDEEQVQKQTKNGEGTDRNKGENSEGKMSKLEEPLPSLSLEQPPNATTLASKQVSESAKVDQKRVVGYEEEGAPSPAIAQRSKSKKSGKNTPDSQLDKIMRRDGSRLKRLSMPMSVAENGSDGHQKGESQSLNRKSVSSPEPGTNPHIEIDGRPSSADSIDDAVDAYLCSPRLSQKIRHPQTGRTISFSEVGDSEGYAVFCCVGMGLTRYITAFYDELALTLKLRLITPDRPGVGDSEAYTDGTATPLSWPDDVYAICQSLKITKFSILAHSAGAIYALATALRMPQHIRGRIHLLAPWIPPSQLNVFGGQQVSPPTNSIPTSQRILRALPTPILKAANSSFMSATSSSITSSLPKSPRRNKRKSTGRDTPALSGRATVTPGPDKENQGPASTDYPKPSEVSAFNRAAADPTDPNSEAAILAAAAHTLAEKERQVIYDTRLTHAIWDLATSGANPAVDLLVCLERRHTIGFRYVDITRAVVIHHGSKDTRVPVDNVKWLGKMMRKCEVRILEGEGHGLMASAGVMGGVLMEIAREWEDWMKVVENKGGVNSEKVRTLRERASAGAFR